METLNSINPVSLIMVTAIVCFAMSFVICVVVCYFIRGRRCEQCIDSSDRYEYPKKECCGDRHLEYNGKLEDVFLGNNDCIRRLDIEHINDYVHFDGYNDVRIHCYMRRGDKQYFRGENVKVVVTVKE